VKKTWLPTIPCQACCSAGFNASRQVFPQLELLAKRLNQYEAQKLNTYHTIGQYGLPRTLLGEVLLS
jgi:hypothetical protein